MKNEVSHGITVRYDAIYLLFNGGSADLLDRVFDELVDQINNFGIYVVFKDIDGISGAEMGEIEKLIKNKPDLFKKYVSIDGDNIEAEDTDDVHDVAYRVPTFAELRRFYDEQIGG